VATRLYFVANLTPSTSPTFDSGWSNTEDAVRRRLHTSKLSATEQITGDTSGAAGDHDLAVQLISPPLDGAQTVSGSFSLVSRVRELDLADNINKRWRHAKVVSNDGTVVRGTLEATVSTGSAVEFSAATLQGQTHALNAGISSVSALDGDRIVVEFGYGNSAAGTTPEFTTEIGGNGTDHANSNGDTTGTVPWVEFSANLTFKAEVTTVALGQAVETETAQALSLNKTIFVSLGQVTETETAQAVTSDRGVPLGQVVETETAQPLILPFVPLGQVEELETAQAISVAKHVLLGQVVESEQAAAFTVKTTSFPVVGAWRKRVGLTWRQGLDDFVASFGPPQGHVSDYFAAGSNPLSAANITALQDGFDLHIFWKPQSGTGTWADVAAGLRDTTVDAAAQSIKNQAPKKIWLTLHHEPEDNVGAAGSGMTAADYRNMWAHVRARFDALNVTNVTWVLVYQNSHSPNAGQMVPLYPGDQYVDIVSQQDYIICTTSPSQLAVKWIEDLDFLTANAGVNRQWHLKPKAVTEWGADLGGDPNPCPTGNRGTVTHRADTIDGITAILPILGQRGVVELRYFDSNNPPTASGFLEPLPSVDAQAFLNLKTTSEAGQTGPILVPLGQALESEIAQPLTVQFSTTLVAQLGQVVETELAQALTVQQTATIFATLGQVVESELAQVLTVVQGTTQFVPLGQVTEQELAQAITAVQFFTQFIPLGQVLEVELAQGLVLTIAGPGPELEFTIRAPSYNFRPKLYRTSFQVTNPGSS